MEEVVTDEVDTEYDSSSPPLDERILEIVKKCPNYTIRPAKLATELGISIEDSSKELCGLLSAVGSGATFSFEKNPVTDGPPIMVFTFPQDFERKALLTRRKQDMKEIGHGILLFLVKMIKVLTAFGLILSLLIIIIGAMLGLIAAIVAMARGGGDRNNHFRSAAIYRLRRLFYTVRQLLWCYAMFGHNFEGQDPFLSEMAYDLWLCGSVCCGNPTSIFFWIRASQLNRRRQHARRGWGGHRVFNYSNNDDLEGVSLVRRGEWTENNVSRTTSRRSRGATGTTASDNDEYRGLLSIAVEFLFGPTPFSPGPCETDKWKMRASTIFQMSLSSANSFDNCSVSLGQLSPWYDSPPKSLDDAAGVAAGLNIVSHFNGVPAAMNQIQNDVSSVEPKNARFVFPELLAESDSVAFIDENIPQIEDDSWQSVFYVIPKENLPSLGNGNTLNGTSSSEISFLYEKRYVLTRLEKKQFLYCAGLGLLNYIGVIWLKQSLQSPGAVLYVGVEGALPFFLGKVLIPILHGYAILFFFLPISRLCLILIFNYFRKERNEQRARIAQELKQLLLTSNCKYSQSREGEYDEHQASDSGNLATI